MRASIALCFVLASFIVAIEAYGQGISLPDSAQVHRDDSGNIVAVQIAGKSNRERLALEPATIQTLSALSHLESLSLWGTTVADDDIEQLSGLKKLRTIDLAFTDVTGACLRTLSSLENLVSIRLEGCEIEDADLAPLSKMPQLAMLYLGQTSISDAGLKHIRGLENLILLQLSDCDITDDGLSTIEDLPKIQQLWLSKTIHYGEDDRSNLTDKCVDHLVSLDTLIDLQIADSQLTNTGLERLRDRLSKAKINTIRTGVTYVNRKKP